MQEAIQHLRTADPVIGGIIDRVGPYAIQFRDPDFECLVKSIIFQQLSGRVAQVIFDRLRVAAAGEGALTADGVLRLRMDRMRRVGLSKQKITYIRDLARLTRRGEIDFAVLPELPDEEVIRRLTEVKGIGEWTAHMFLIFALRRTNVLPVGDLGIRSAVRQAYGLPDLPKPKELEQIGSAWRPYCSVASWYLWRSLEPDANL